MTLDAYAGLDSQACRLLRYPCHMRVLMAPMTHAFCSSPLNQVSGLSISASETHQKFFNIDTQALTER